MPQELQVPLSPNDPLAGLTINDNMGAAASSALPTAAPQQQTKPAATSQLIELIRAISGGGMSGPMTTMQPSMHTPSMPPEFQIGGGQVAQGPFGSVGERKRADAQATINNLANFSKSVTDYLHQKKVREYSTTIEKVMNAQGGMAEAQSALEAAQAKLKENPKDLAAIAEMQKAQDNLAHNQEVLSTVGADPKTAKILEKAFSVKLLGDDKGKASPEYQALQQAIKNKDSAAQKAAGLEMMKKFQATQPTRQQISPQYQAMAQLIKDKVIPEANERLKQQTELIKNVNDVQQKYSAQESRERLGKMLADSKDKASQAMILKQVLANQGRLGAAGVMAEASKYRADRMAYAMMQDTQWRMAGEVLKSRASGKGASQAFNNLSKEHQRITDEIKDAQKQLAGVTLTDKASDLYHGVSRTKDIQAKLDDLRQRQQMIIQKMGQLNFGADSGGADGSKPTITDQDSGFAEFDRFFESLTTEQDSSDSDSN
jgi:hypothetical protein